MFLFLSEREAHEILLAMLVTFVSVFVSFFIV